MNSDTIHAWASIADFCVKFGLIILALLCVEFSIRLALIWDNLRNEQGTDRICWLIVLGIPIFGPLAYIFIALKERDDRLNSSGMPPGSGLREPSPESLAWAAKVLEREGIPLKR